MTKPDKELSQQEATRLFGSRKPTPGSKRSQSTEKTRIHNLAELKKLVNRLKPETNAPPPPIVVDTKGTEMADEKYSGQVVIPQSSGQSTLRQTILDGFEIVKNHQEYHNASVASQDLDYGGFPPAIAPDPSKHMMWIDHFIDRNMGGKREGLHIVWELPEGKFRLDPWSCKLEKVNAS